MTSDLHEHDTGQPCAAWIGAIVRAAEGSPVDDEAGRGLDGHLRTCAACRDALAVQRQARAALADWPRPNVSPDFSARVLAAIDDETDWTTWLDFRRWTWRLAPAAAALALVAAVVLQQTTGVQAEDSSGVESDAAAASAIWSPAVSEADFVSLLLTADADDPLSAALELEESVP